MNIGKILMVGVIAALVTPVAVIAQDNPNCTSELNMVETEIDIAVFLDSPNPRKKGADSETNRSNLLTKLEDARTKVAFEKYERAIDKLMDISDKATEWTNAAKQKLEDASGINYAVADAMVCVGNLGTASN